MDPWTLALVVLLGVALSAVVAWWIWLLLSRATAEGGAVDGDPTDIATQVMAEANAFRGSPDHDSPAWDGSNRLGPPTTDGGWLAWSFWFTSRAERLRRAQVKKSGKP